MPGPKIVVIGAGPAGLTFTRLLQKNGVACTVYEAEKDRDVRNQGGSLDLHPKAGQRALKEAGLLEEFRKLSRPEGQADKIVRYNGEVLWDENELGSISPEEMDDQPEIDRNDLRSLLLDSVEPSCVKWDHKISQIEADPRTRGKSIVHFADGSKEVDIDLVVGADGAWSKVRPLITDVMPYYSGITMMPKYVGEGSFFMFDEGRAVIAQRNSNDNVRVYAGLRQPEDWADKCGIDWSDHQAAREALVKDYFGDCSDDIKRLILESRDDCLVRQLYMMPVGQEWKTCPGVALLGDSAHLMTPFAGVGVNLAMADALQLAYKLVSRKDSFVAKAFSDQRNIGAAVKDYEKEMFERSKEYGQKTYDGLVGHFSKDGGKERADKFKIHYEAMKAKGLCKESEARVAFVWTSDQYRLVVFHF